VANAQQILDESGLSIERIDQLAQGPVSLGLPPESWKRISASREMVERQLRSGTPIYGATTGIGSQKDVAVTPDRLEDFSDRMIISEATDFPGDLFPERVVRAALLVLINNLARGRTGVRPIVVERLLELLASSRMPAVRRDTSYGVADLTPLSQLCLALLGRSLHGEPSPPQPPLKLAPKESVSLIDNNSFALGHGALVLTEVERLLCSFDLAAALALEGLRGGMAAQSLSAAGDRPGAGHVRSRRNLLAALEGSALHLPGRARFLQDPLSFRSVTQIHGAAHEAWAWAKQQFEAEINSSVDNPLVDLQTGGLLTSSSMISLLPVLSMDCLRQALAKVAIQSTERAIKLQSPPFSGLPVGLSEDHAPDGGVLSINLNYIGAARMGTLLSAAAPVLLHYVGHTSDGVEDVSALTPLSVAQTESLLIRAWEIVSLEVTIAVWAIARRKLPTEDLGIGVRKVYEMVRPLLPIGHEGTRVFDTSRIVSMVKSDNFLSAAA
jgi:histidine ammonia-lyase